MALRVIGSGMGRTGTRSLQLALNILGLGPCHHMFEVMAHPESRALWIEAGNGRPDWDAIFAGYQSAVDYPSAAYWRELATYYPDAKILHTVRDADAWFDSAQKTIFSQAVFESAGFDFITSFFGDLVEHVHDRAFMIDYFLRHTEEVKATIPPDRLLICEARQGWGPLCEFLDLPIPDAPYPSENSREDFRAEGRTLKRFTQE